MLGYVTSKKGQWIQMGNNPNWRNGAYTSFYNTGTIYVKGKI
jgi:hypothetical protein